MRKLSYLLVVFLFVGITSCEEVENLNKDKFTFSVDGEEVDYSSNAEYGQLEESGSYVIRGRKNDSIVFMITVPEFSETRYSSASDEVSFIYTTETNAYVSGVSDSYVEVIIDSYEKGDRIEGTFSGTLYTVFGDESVEITNGEFRVNN